MTAIDAQTSTICFPLTVLWLSLSLYDFNHLLSRPLGMKLYSFSLPPFLSLFIIKILQNNLLKENWFHLSSLICPIVAESLVRALVTLSKVFFHSSIEIKKLKSPDSHAFEIESHGWAPPASPSSLSRSLHALLLMTVFRNSIILRSM